VQPGVAVAEIDEKTLSSLIDQIYDAALDPSRWPRFLENLGKALHAGVRLFPQDVPSDASSPGSGVDPPNAASCEAALFNQALWVSHPRPKGREGQGPDRPGADSPERDAFCATGPDPPGRLEGAGGLTLQRAATAITAALTRGADPGAPSEGESDILMTRLMPHLRRALEIDRELAFVRLQRDGALEALEGLAIGMAFSTPDGRLLSCNPAGERILAAGRGLRLNGGYLRAENAAATDHLRRLIARAAAPPPGRGSEPGGMIRLPCGSEPCVCVLVSPARTGARPFGLAREPLAMLLMFDPQQQRAIRPADLTEVYGLSPAEARLLESLVKGERLADYAEASGLSLNTAKTQLAQVFSKTGANRQSDLIRRVLSDLSLRIMPDPKSRDRSSPDRSSLSRPSVPGS